MARALASVLGIAVCSPGTARNELLHYQTSAVPAYWLPDPSTPQHADNAGPSGCEPSARRPFSMNTLPAAAHFQDVGVGDGACMPVSAGVGKTALHVLYLCCLTRLARGVPSSLVLQGRAKAAPLGRMDDHDAFVSQGRALADDRARYVHALFRLQVLYARLLRGRADGVVCTYVHGRLLVFLLFVHNHRYIIGLKRTTATIRIAYRMITWQQLVLGGEGERSGRRGGIESRGICSSLRTNRPNSVSCSASTRRWWQRTVFHGKYSAHRSPNHVCAAS